MNTQINKIRAILLRLGLGEIDVSVYTYLVQKPHASIMDISRGLDIFRPAIYKSLARLADKRLVTKLVSGKRTVYSASDPSTLRDMVRDLSIDLEETLPDIEDLYAKRGDAPVIRVFKGKDSITAVFSDIVDTLPHGDVFYRYTSEKDLDKVNRYLPRNYREKRDAKRLERLVISNASSGSRKKPRLERFIKFVPQKDDSFSQDAIKLVYGDKIALIDLAQETGFIIENKSLAEFEKAIFRLLYKRL